jgi:hypothetical protein
MDSPLKVTDFPTERSDAYARSDFTGNLLVKQLQSGFADRSSGSDDCYSDT